MVELGHEEAVSKSLDSAVHRTLQGLYMFTRKRAENQEKSTLTQASITQSKAGKISSLSCLNSALQMTIKKGS